MKGKESVSSGQTNFKERPSVGRMHFFVVASLVAFLAVAGLMGYFFRQMAIENLMHDAEIEHIRLAQVIGNQTGEDVFGPWVEATRDKSPDQIRVSLSYLPIERKLMMRLKGTRIFKIKAYDTRGVTIFSTDLRQIGEDKHTNSGVMAGLVGLSSSRMSHRDQVSEFEGEVQPRDLVESYVPHYDTATGKINGVFEIYGDATNLLAEIDKRQWQLMFLVIAPLVLLYLALFAIVKQSWLGSDPSN